jgi:glutathione S-transferase
MSASTDRMKLLWNPASPYARKVRVLAIETGLDQQIDEEVVVVALHDPNPSMAAHNPLMKLPTLLRPGKVPLFDSVVISQYLDTLHSGRPFLAATGESRWKAMRREAMADGMLDAGLLVKNELNARPEGLRWSKWVDSHRKRITQTLDQLEQEVNEFPEDLDIGQIAVACAIGWIVFRKVIANTFADRPRLARWFNECEGRPSMQRTKP